MRQFFAIAAIAPLLAACAHLDKDPTVVQAVADKDQVEDNVGARVMSVADTVRDNITRTANKMHDWWVTPLPEYKKHEIAASYCYYALQDIMCYRQPMPGWEHRLVAYQGSHAVTPPPAMMQPLPKESANAGLSPEARVAAMKPVFDKMPVKEDSKEEKVQDSAVPPVVDPTREQLPNPAMVPQL